MERLGIERDAPCFIARNAHDMEMSVNGRMGVNICAIRTCDPIAKPSQAGVGGNRDSGAHSRMMAAQTYLNLHPPNYDEQNVHSAISKRAIRGGKGTRPVVPLLTETKL